MDIVRRRRAKAIFQEALEREPSTRAKFVAAESRGDVEVECAARELLSSHDSAGEFLGQPTIVPGKTLHGVDEEQPGARVGRYQLVESIGVGGFGVVWKAEQEEPVRRTVALKVIKLGMDTKQVVARFEAERQALALMDHPNIAQVLDAGATAAGRPYFVMELVRGVPITRFCDEQRLTTRERLALFASVCRAVQHAHQKGVIHRDIKPGNVLVALHDGEPVAKVIDFGIAKATSARLTERTLMTEVRQLMGTPGYMAPEQAEASGLDVDTRADVYALGGLLYELLTGQKPLDIQSSPDMTWDEILRTIRSVDPLRPSARVAALDEDAQRKLAAERNETAHLSRRLRGDLDWIAMKALEKDRARRYETATALADDVERHLHHLPVLAGPPSRMYQFQKLVRRHRATFVAALIVFATLVAGIAFSTYGFVEASDQRDRATDREKLAQRELATRTQVAQLMADMLAGAGPEIARGRDASLLREILEQASRRIDQELVGQDEVRGELMSVIGTTWREIGEFEKSEEILRASLALRRKALGPNSRSVGVVLIDLALTLTDRGKLDEAERLARDGLAIVRGLPGEHWVDLVNSCNGLATVLLRKSTNADHVEAEKLLHESLDIGRMHAEVPPNFATLALSYLADLARERGDLEEAESLDEQILERDREQFGPDHPRTISAENSVAVVMLDSGRAQAARERLEEILESAQRVHGEHSVIAAITLENLAQAKSRLGDREQALKDYDQVIADYRAAYKGDHSNLARALFRRAHLAYEMGDLDAAKPMLDESVEMNRRVAGDGPASIAQALVDLAWIAEAHGQTDEADGLMRSAVDAAVRFHGASAHDTGVVQIERGGLLLKQNRPAEALDMMRTALAVLREAPHSDPHEIATALGNVVQAGAESGDFASAESAAHEALDLYSARIPDETVHVERIRYALMNMYCKEHRCDEAGAMATELARARRAGWSADDARHGPLVVNYALELFYGGCFEPAAAMAREALAIERARTKPDVDGFTMAGVALASILVECPESTRDEARNLDESVALARECLARIDDAHLDDVRRSGQELFLGDVLIERARRLNDPSTLAEAEELLVSAVAKREAKLPKDDWRTEMARAAVALVPAVRALPEPARADDVTSVSARRAALTEARDRLLPVLEGLRTRTDVPEPVRRTRYTLMFTTLARTLDALADGSAEDRARADAWRTAAVESRRGQE